ncbi:lantibiotic dehydratase C-terminal domain-containing protein [Kitasatospora sp. MBT63]|uniref:lantibiotic dehydratase C-terminal domain-containing protein n=1 Tax=Kitasatospora sp. MBT63 TaxID=1444768 RepID=UPI000A8591C1|nr:lantibiotic dehydratase C-terminal domain-containing protein [Kitasatospora sp. MBT63]
MTETPTDPADGAARDVVAYYHHPVKGPLLRGVVLPLADRCAAEGLTVHVERHWLHGPHLRLRLRGPAAQVADTAARGAAQLRDWLRRHPSVSDQGTGELLAAAAEAGRAELIAPPYGPIVPDNTVRVERVDLTGLRSLIGADGVLLRDELLGMGRPALHAAADFLGRNRDGAAARVQLAVAALAAHATAHPGGLVGGHYSYVSHLEDFLVHDDPDGRLRRAFEDRWEAAGKAVTALVARIGAGGATGWEQAWAGWSAAAWRLAERRHTAGADLGGHPYEYRVRAAATGDAAAAERWNQDVRTRYSEFHRLLRRSDPQGAMWSRPEYLVYRACTNALYRLFAVCDLRPLERYLAAHLVVRAAPAVTGHDWRRQVDTVIDAVERAS